MCKEENQQDIKESLNNLPDSPGVYLHKDKDGTIIYVGKAISLKNRVRQYFQASRNLDPKVRAMVKNIAEFSYIRTKTEMEALILECNLIKKYMPKYNVLLRDDKTFPYIKITSQEKWPRLVKTRMLEKDKGEYYGPYTDVGVVNCIIDLLNSVYSLKRCSTTNFPENFTPCLNFHIHQCQGICTGNASEEKYKDVIEEVREFLKGKNQPVLEYLTKRMNEEAENMNYELAAEYRDYIGFVHEMTKMAKIARASQVAKEAKKAERERHLDERAIKQKERILAEEDALNEIIRKNQKRLYGWRIEAYDISNTNGVDSVGAMVVFKEGKPEKAQYRRFKINTVEGSNDYGSLMEVLYRRFKRAKEGDKSFATLPDLILMDGGAAQVSVAKQVIKAMELNLPVAGIVKDNKHRTRGLIFEGEETNLKEYPKLYHFLGRIQEEVHRFAISYHRDVRGKSMTASALDNIEGIGEKRRNSLLEHFKSVDAIKEATLDELSQAPNMNKSAGQRVYDYFHEKTFTVDS